MLFTRKLQDEWNKQQKPSPLPEMSLPSSWSETVIKKAGETFTNYFKNLPTEAHSLPSFISFFRPVAKKQIMPRAPLPSLPSAPSFGGSKSITSPSLLSSSSPPSSLSAPQPSSPLPPVPIGLNCTNLKADSPVEYIEGYKYMDTHKKIMSLTRGKTFFTFACHSGSTLTDMEILHADTIVNLSGFKDELADNGVEAVNIRNPQEAALYTVAIVKNAYMLPHTKLEDFTPELLCSQEYLHACMPGPPKIWKEVPDKTTFRITKTIVPWVFNMTIQFKVSVLDPNTHVALSK